MPLFITTDSQLEYLFARVRELEALIRLMERRDEQRLTLISQLQDRCDVFSDAIVDALHGKTLDESFEQAFDRIMADLRATNVDTHT